MADHGKTEKNVDGEPFSDRLVAGIASFRTRPPAARLGLALLAVAIALAARLLLFGEIAKDYPYVTIYPAVALAAIFGGWESGLLATALCAVLVHVLGAFGSETLEVLTQAAFLIDCGLIVVLAELAQRNHANFVRARLAAQNRALLRLFVEQAPAPMAMFDRNMVYLAMSKAWMADHGVGGGAIGRSHDQLFPEFPERWTDIHRRALAGETISGDRDCFRRADGSPRWLNWQVCPWRYPDGRIGGLVIYTEDVTPRVRSEESLRENEAMLRTLSDNLPESLIYRVADEADGTSRFVYISAGVEKLNGVTAEQVLRDPNVLYSQILPEYLPKLQEAERRSRREQSDFAMDAPMRRPDGEVRWMRLRSRPVRAPDGRIVWHGVQTDVTALKRTEQAALESKNTLEAAVAAMTDAVVITDAQGACLHCNDACAVFHRFGNAAACPMKRTGCEHLFTACTLDGDEVPLEQRPVSRALRGESGVDAEYLLRQKETGEKWFGSYSFAPIRDDAGAVIGSVVTARDITAQRRTETALREEERRREAIVNSALEGVIAIDSAGVIQSVNPAAQAMFGYDLDEMIGRNVGMLMTEPHAARHDSYIAAYLAGGAPTILGSRRRVEGRRKNGEVFPKELTVTEARVDRHVLFIGFMRDLSAIEAEKRRADALRDELAHAARLADMGEVVAGLAHELGQPLAAIGNFIAAARRLAAKGEASRLAEAIDKADAQARRAADILARLRGFLEKRQAVRRPENLGELTEEAINLTFLRARGRAVRIVTRIDDNAILVNVDRVQIQQVIANLIRNAAESCAGLPDAEIVVAAKMSDPGSVEVSVRDNGPGVDPGVADRLFSPFVSTKASGMGVGLSLCRSIIEGHQGTIGYRPCEPHGAEFHFTLPIVQPEAGRRILEFGEP